MLNSQSKRYLFYINQNYSYEILRPLQQEILTRGDQVKWFITGKEVNPALLKPDEVALENIKDVVAYSPHASFVPGNEIPRFIPGLKVQVFHGLEWKKKGHFIIRDYFDLYCTHGSATTKRFEQLAKQHQYFDVVETGWPKLDNLFNAKAIKYFDKEKQVILYAPTFSPALTSAPALFETISALVKEQRYNWLFKFHPKMAKEWIDKYQTLSSANCKVIETADLNPVLQSADVMISDTSSVIGEFSLLDKPVIALNNREPGDYLINISNAEQLPLAIEKAFSPSDHLLDAIKEYAKSLHPYTDGGSSARILDAVEQRILNGKNAKKTIPLNLFRNFKLRKKLGYWQF
ncbi:CDP-glycerol glycerophosphotransferase family protein [Thalassotalea ganghwensis]